LKQYRITQLETPNRDLLGTKLLVPKCDIGAVQKNMLDAGYGYELNLSKSFMPHNFRRGTSKIAVFAVYVDFSGYIKYERLEKDLSNEDEFYRQYFRSDFEEMDHTVVL